MTGPRDRVFALLAILPLGLLAALVALESVDLPFWDQWDLVLDLERVHEGTFKVGDLLRAHNEHLIVFPRAIHLGLALASGWNTRLEVAFNLLLAVGAAALMGRQARGGWWLLPIVSVLAFSLRQHENWLWGFQTPVFLAVLGMLGAFACLERGRLAGAVACGVVATFSFASGLLVWPVGFLLVKRERRLAWGIASAIAIALVIAGRGRGGAFPSIGEMTLFVLVFLGAPVAPPLSGGGTRWDVIAAAGFGLVAIGVVVMLLRERELRFWAAVGLFVLGTAVLAGLGRASGDPGIGLASRYQTLATPLWVGAAVLAGTWLPRAPRLATAGLAVLVALVLWGDIAARPAFSARRRALESVRDALRAGYKGPFLRNVHPDPAVPAARAEVLRKRKLSLFR